MARTKPRQRAGVGVLGKAVTRRARSRCELCEGRDDLRLYELDPFPEEPTEERVLLACGRCRTWLEQDAIVVDEAHFLCGAAWSEEPAVKLAAGRMLLASEAAPEPWLHDALDAVGIDRETRELTPPAWGL